MIFLLQTKRPSTLSAILMIAIFLSGCDPQIDEQTYFQNARDYQTKGEYQAAIIELKNVLKKNPSNREARLLLGQLSLKVGESPMAEKELRRALQLGTPHAQVILPLGNALLAQRKYEQVLSDIELEASFDKQIKPEVLLLRGAAQLGLGNHEEAGQIFHDVLKIRMDSVEALAGLAKIMALSGDIKEAESYLGQALAIDANHIESLLLKGQLEMQRGNYAEAEETFKDVLSKHSPNYITWNIFAARVGLIEAQLGQGKSTKAKVNIELLTKQFPEHAIPKFFQARLAFGAGDFDTAVAMLLEVIQKAPGHKPTLMLLGAVYYNQGNLEQADMYLSNLLAADPSDPSARKLLAATRIQLNEPENAIETLTPALETSTKDSLVLAMLSTASFRSGDLEGGISYLDQITGSEPKTQSLKIDLAAAYLKKGMVDDALDVLKALSDDPDTTYRREVMLVLAFLTKNDSRAALKHAKNLVAHYDNDANAHNILGLAYFTTDENSLARDHFNRALELNAKHVPSFVNLGRLEYKEGRLEKARSYFEKAIDIDSGNLTALLSLASLADKQGNQAQFVELLERARSQNSRAAGPRLILIQYYMRQRQFDTAHSIAKEAAQVQPQNAEVQNALGVTQLWVRDHPGALKSFLKAAEIAPDSPNINHNLARAYLALKDLEAASKALHQVLEIQPDYIPALTTLAFLEVSTGNTAQALDRAKLLQQREAKSSVGYALEGDLQMMKGKFSEAAQAYETASMKAGSAGLAIKSFVARTKANLEDPYIPLVEWLAKHPNDKRIQLILAQAYQKNGRQKSAIEHYESILKDDPDHIVSLNNLAWIYFKQNDPRASTLAEKAHLLSPNEGGITDTLGWIHTEQGELKRGLKLLRLANQQLPNNVEIQYHLVVALYRAGETQEARKTLEQLLQTGKPFPERQNAQQILEKLNQGL